MMLDFLILRANKIFCVYPEDSDESVFFFSIIESEYALYVKQKTNEMLGYLNVVEDKQFKVWCITVPQICKLHLAKNLIYRDPPFVRNNFSPEVSNIWF